ncbi:MAG: alpha-mannosidase [Anaerolineae bacterium]
MEAKNYTVHMIGNAHIDHVWLWRWPEARDEVLATCRSALNLMKETPGFIFSFGSAVSYRWIREADPETFEEIRQRVSEGRWNIVGGWWLEPDCNLPCGESFVRQILYGKLYFLENFGVEVTVGYNIDSFGHAGTLPQILRKSGQLYYVFFRPDPACEIELESSLFWWEAPDGSRVLACRPPLHYNSGPDDIEDRIWAAYLKTHPLLRDVLCFYGVGNHGGGPTRANLETIQRLVSRTDSPRVEFSTLERFFQAAVAQATDFPVHRRGLQYHARGCYTAVSEVKRHNRKAENLLVSAEKFSALVARSFAKPYPYEALTKAWQNVLFNQFHDLLGGSCIPEAYEDAREMYEETYRLAGDALRDALKAIAARVDTRGPGAPLLVFNPLAWPRRSPAEVEIPWDGAPESLRLLDDRGEEVPVQVAASEKPGCVRALFIANVSALGYRVYHVAGAKESVNTPAPLAGETWLESTRWRLEVDPAAGHLARLYDKLHAVEVLAGPGLLPLVLDDPSDTWSHGIEAYRDEIGCFGNAQVTRSEAGPVRAALQIYSTFGDSSLWQEVRLYPELEYIECLLTVDWHEKWRMLKLCFPCNLAWPTATCEIPYGHTTCPTDGSEQPGQAWLDLTGIARNAEGKPLLYGLGLVNDCKYGFSVQGPGTSESGEVQAEARLSILRSPPYAYHEGGPLPWGPGKLEVYTDQGTQAILIGLLPHPGCWQESSLVRLAYELNNPLITFPEPAHAGELPPACAFAEVEPENVILHVIKRAEGSEDLILRLYETAGRETRARVSLPHLVSSWEGSMGRNEIKTLKLTEGGRLAETDLLEREKPAHPPD